MGTEVALTFSTLRAQLENEKSSLYKIDENIKKIVQTSGRFHNDRFTPVGEYARGGNRTGNRNAYPDASGNFNRNEEFGKKKQETKTVFSRLSARTMDDAEDEAGGKRARVESAVCRWLPSRAAVLRAQGGDEQSRTRNRRIFGSLLGTLQKFKQEEIGLQTKEEKKAQVERKIEEQARLEKEREQKERKTLFSEREHKKATIKALEAKMARVQEFERWEESQKHLGNFILTKVKPHVYWIPKKMEDKANEKLESSRKYHEKCMTKKRQELQEELQRIEARCLRPRGPGAKENDPASREDHQERREDHQEDTPEDGERRKRDKFAPEVEHDDSDGDDRHDDVEMKQETDNNSSALEAPEAQPELPPDLMDTDVSMQSVENGLAPSGDPRDFGLPGDPRDFGPPGDPRDSALPGDPQDSALPGDPRDSGPPEDPRDPGPPGASRDSGLHGDPPASQDSQPGVAPPGTEDLPVTADIGEDHS